MVVFTSGCAAPGIGFQTAISCAAQNFVFWQIPLYLLVFSILFIVLAKLLNSALTALPIAIIVTAATVAYFVLATRSFFFGVSDIVILIGILIAYAVVARMFFKV